MESFALILACLLIGSGLRRLPQFPEQTATVLNLFIIYVALPALVLRTIPALSLTPALLVPALMPWAVLAVTAPAVLLLAGLAPELSAALVGAGILLSFATLPALALLL